MKKILALIPARAGSRGIPKKNIIDLGGHPLLAYSVAAAKLSKFINRIIVSTDSEEFAAVARKYGAETPFIRPKEYATDQAADKPYYKHALDWLEENENYLPDFVVNLRPTVPVRNPKTIDRAILKLISDKKATALRSAHLTKKPAYKMFRMKGDYIKFFGGEDFKENEEYHDCCRQYLPPTYIINAYVDVLIPKTLRSMGMVHGNKIRAFITKMVPDIDDYEDIRLTEKLLEEKEFLPLINFLNEIKK